MRFYPAWNAKLQGLALVAMFETEVILSLYKQSWRIVGEGWVCGEVHFLAKMSLHLVL